MLAQLYGFVLHLASTFDTARFNHLLSQATVAASLSSFWAHLSLPKLESVLRFDLLLPVFAYLVVPLLLLVLWAFTLKPVATIGAEYRPLVTSNESSGEVSCNRLSKSARVSLQPSSTSKQHQLSKQKPPLSTLNLVLEGTSIIPLSKKSVTSQKSQLLVSLPQPNMNASAAIKQHRILADQAYQTISSALSLEEADKNNSAMALELYKKGVRELRAALRVSFLTQAELEYVEPMNVKLRGNLAMTEDRIKELSIKLQISPVTKQSGRATPATSSRVNSVASSRSGSGTVR
ncbi:hypothetical protein BDR26DRAFT_536386 [Obelidium mucronatum]|nr:hypothetical protein BDR26DRAFT_536386 [Obelidium mucronatum]